MSRAVFDGGVSDISRSRTITAHAEAIWDVLADFGSLSSWADDVDHSCILNHGPEGPLGTTRRVQLGRNAFVERIVEFDPPVTLGYDIEGLPKRLRAVNRWTLQPQGAETVVTLASTLEIEAGPLSDPVEWVLCRGMARQSDSLLAGLARRLEEPHG